MIVFDLICAESHRFEAWFRSNDDFAAQKKNGLLECPFCDSSNVVKAIMAPNVGVKSNQKPPNLNKAAEPSNRADLPKPVKFDGQHLGFASQAKQATEIMKAVSNFVSQNFENVGDGFAEEARKIHYGEADDRGIYGHASKPEVEDLLDEGIDLIPLIGPRHIDS